MTGNIRRQRFCPHCGNQAPQSLLHTQRHPMRSWSVSTGEESDPAAWSTFVVSCETCWQVLLYDNPGDQLADTDFHHGTLLYPEHGLDQPIPDSVRNAYREASRIRELAPNAFAVQIRRALEALCDDREAKGKTLAVKLKNLADNSKIPPPLADIAKILRLSGNIGAHSSSKQIHQLQVYRLDKLFRLIIEYTYLIPAELETLQREIVEHQE